MTRKEYKEILRYELYKYAHTELNLLQKLRIRYFQPNTNCVLLARKMWYFYSRGKVHRFISKLIYLKILHRYGCVIFPSAQIGKGFHITHPVGIVIGQCKVGEDFMVFQNCSIGSKKPGDGEHLIGNNVRLGSNSVLIGHISVADNVVIGAHSLVIKDITEEGTYGGNPLKKLNCG